MDSHTQAVQEAYDQLAPTYDADVTASMIGRLQRQALWRRLDRLFQPGQRVLDLGCGTGEDALHLAQQGITVHGIDVSPGMVEIAGYRTASEPRITVEALSMEALSQLRGPYDGAFSSFGPINCVRDLTVLCNDLARLVKLGGVIALCVMNRRCLWETVLQPLTAWLHRRESLDSAWHDSAAEDGAFEALYPSLREVAQAFAPHFRLHGAPGLGLFLPPTYLEPLAIRRPRLIQLLAQADRRTAHLPLLRRFAENRLIVLRRF